MITIASVYWKGNFRGRQRWFDETWVEKLNNMVSRNLHIPHRFVCLSNVEVPCERIPLIHNWPGYWSKMELFRPGLFEDRVIFMDLDVLVLKDLQPIVDFDSKFAMSDTTGRPRMKEGKHMLCKNSSSLMVWDAGEVDYLYEEFVKNPDKWMKHYFGDQDYIAGESKSRDTLPFEWAKKLRDCPGFNPTEGLIVAYCQLGGKFPGKNIRVMKECPWARDIWK